MGSQNRTRPSATLSFVAAFPGGVFGAGGNAANRRSFSATFCGRTSVANTRSPPSASTPTPPRITFRTIRYTAQADFSLTSPFHLLLLSTYFSPFPLLKFSSSRRHAFRLRHPSAPRVEVVLSAILVLCARELEAGAAVAGISDRLGEQRREVRLLDIDRVGQPRGDARVSEQRGAHERDAEAAAMVRRGLVRPLGTARGERARHRCCLRSVVARREALEGAHAIGAASGGPDRVRGAAARDAATEENRCLRYPYRHLT